MKKIISFVLAAVLLVSAVPTALATNDYSQGTQVVYEATGSESYTITVPAKLAPGGSGTVTLQGTWADNRIITVTAEPTVTLTNSIKAEDQKVLNVHFDGISEAGSNTSKQTFTEPVSVEGISNALFGTWSGKFNYNVDSTTEEVVPPDENYIGTVSADNTITLSGVETAGTYTLRYANADGALENYADICSLEVTDPATAVSYDDLIAENCAPVEATTIAVYNEENEKVGDIALGSLATNLGTKLYSFGALADTHIGYSGAEEKTNRALTYLSETEQVAFTCIPGDLTENATVSELNQFKNIVAAFSSTNPVYASAGNHEGAYMDNAENEISLYTGNPLYYSFTRGNDVFIMVGDVSSSEGELFADGELQWLYETLEANKDKRCFVFEHVRPDEGCGNPSGLYAQDHWGYEEQYSFESFLQHYSNVVFFHAHSHSQFSLQYMSDIANYDNIRGTHSIHISSVAKPRNESNSETDGSEGYVVDVYENGIILRGREFVEEKFLPIAQYYLDTTIKAVGDGEVTVPIDMDLQYGIKLDTTDGTESDADNYSASPMLEVEKAVYTVGITTANYAHISICCYDEDGNYIGCLEKIIQGPSDDNYIAMETEFTPLDGTTYIRFRCRTPFTGSNVPIDVVLARFWATKTIAVG